MFAFLVCFFPALLKRKMREKKWEKEGKERAGRTDKAKSILPLRDNNMYLTANKGNAK